MTTRFISLSLALVILFISLKTFSQVKNNLEKFGGNQSSVLDNPGIHLQKKTARIFLANETTTYGSNTDIPNTVQNSFTECFKDDLASDFALGGSTDVNASISSRINGELILNTEVPDEDFNETPVGWNGSPWKTGGTTDFTGGIAILEGSRIYTNQTYLPNTSIEFAAMFTAGNFENIGFAKNGNFDNYWLAIGRGEAGSDPNLYVRTSDGVSVFLGSNLLNEFHNYRITWGEASFTIYVDEVLTATIIKTYTTRLTLVASDYYNDGHPLSVDWVRYGASHPGFGTYDSKVIPISSSTASIRVNWNATLAENTEIEIRVRSGNTPVPDDTWTNYTKVSNNEVINISNSYLQYYVSLSSYGGKFTPVLNDISFSCSSEQVPTVISAPLISNILIGPDVNGSVIIEWITDKNSDSRVEYGTSAESLTSIVSDGSLSTFHFLQITGLSQGTTYYVRVSSEDTENNTAISPSITVAPLAFTIPAYTPDCAKDDVFTDFEQGFLKGKTEAVNNINGELSLKPLSVEEQFHNITIPEGWNAGSWAAGSTIDFSFSIVTLNGARVYTTETFEPGASVEFYARFTLGDFQNIGFAKNGNFDPYWLVIGRGRIASDPNLYIRSSEGMNTSLGNNLLDYYHLYRIDWDVEKFKIYVDGILTATVDKVYSSPLVLMVSDYEFDQTAVSVDWTRYTKKIYPNTGVFQSRVFSVGAGPAAVTVNWNSTLPPNTAVTISVRSGNYSSFNDQSNPFVPVANHQPINLGNAYLQYQAVLSTTDSKVTPLLNDISFDCGEVAPVDVSPPVISDIFANIISEGRAVISWSTDEPASGRVDFGTEPGNLTQTFTAGLPAISPGHTVLIPGLKEGITYYYRVAATDVANNSTQSPVASLQPLQFTYPFLSNVCAKDEHATDFEAGETGTNTEILYNIFFGNDGSIALKKPENTVTEEFNSSILPAGWNAGIWNSGGATVFSNGIATLNGTHIYKTQKFNPGSSITFTAKFTLGNFENIGFAQNNNFDPFWIVIGRGQLGPDPNLFIRSSDGINISLGSNLLEEYHSYRITWNNTGFTFFVDGKPAGLVSKTISFPMVLQISDFNSDATSLSVERIRFGFSYPASGTFISRVLSLGSMPENVSMDWNNGSGNINNFENTDMVISVRSGNTLAPDGSWTEFQDVSNFQLLRVHGSYLQYKAKLFSKDMETSPSLADIRFTCSGSQPGNAKTYTLSPAQQSILKTSQTFTLEQNRPNPFNNNTVISYTVPKPVRVLLTIFDMQGRVVKIAEDVHRSAGKYSVNIDTRNMGKGVYFYRIQAGEFTATKRMIVE